MLAGINSYLMTSRTSRQLVLVLVPVLLVFPAAGLAAWYYRHRLRRACAKVLKRGGAKEKNKDGDDEVSMDDIKKEGGARKISTTSAASHAGVASAAAAGEGVASRLYTATPTANSADGEMQLKQDSSSSAIDKWEFPRHQMRFLSLIGEGCFGQVWKYEADGIMEHCGGGGGNNNSQEQHNNSSSSSKVQMSTTVVAVKTLKNSATDKEKTDLLQELDIMKMLDPHPNVVRLLGCCTEKGQSL